MSQGTSATSGLPQGTTRFRDGASWQAKAGYSRAVRRGNIIAVSGTTSSGPDGQPLFPGDTWAQTADAIARGLEAVAALGGTVADVIRTRIYLDPQADWEGAAEAHHEAFTKVAPANTMLHVDTLIGPGLLAEVEIEALLIDESGEGRS